MPEPATEQEATAAVIELWSKSSALKHKLAAVLAREIASLPPNTLVNSSMKIQVKYATSHSVAVAARNLLADANLIHKAGRRYYTGRAALSPVKIPTGKVKNFLTSFTRSVVTAITHGRTKQRPAPALPARAMPGQRQQPKAEGQMNSTPGIVTLHSRAARLLAVEVLLSEPEELGSDEALESLYLLREKLCEDGMKTSGHLARDAFPPPSPQPAAMP